MENIRDIIEKLDTAENIKQTNSADRPIQNTASDSIDCEICDDKGWVTPDVSIEHPDFGSHHPCICRQNATNDTSERRLKEYSNLSNLSHYTFDNLDPKGKDNNINTNIFQNAFKESFEFSIAPSNCVESLSDSKIRRIFINAP